jgi:hypothetical protein
MRIADCGLRTADCVFRGGKHMNHNNGACFADPT